MTGTPASAIADAQIVRRHLQDCMVMQATLFTGPAYSRDEALAALARLERRVTDRFS